MPFVADQQTAAKKSGFVPDEQLAPLVDPAQTPEAMAAGREAVKVRSAAAREREDFIRQNVQAGVPLDVDAELPAALRARVSLESDPKRQADIIAKEPGILGTRVSKDGRNVIARVQGEDGKPKDVALHPKTSTVSAGDIAGATAPILKAGGAAALGAATGGASLPLTAAAMGGGTALMEAGSLGLSRVLADQDIDPVDIAKRSGKEGAINAALPLAAEAVTRGGSAVLNRLGGAGPTEVATKEAAERLGLPLTPSMARDSGVLREVERRSLTGGKGFEEEQRGALAATKDRALGPSGRAGVLSQEDVAERTAPILADSERAASEHVRRGMTDAERAAHTQIQAELDSGLVPTTRSTSEVGDFVREKIAGKGPDSKASQLRSGAKKLYDEANRLAETEGIVVEPSSISALASKLTAEDKKALLELAPGIRKIPAINRVLTEGTPAVPAGPTGLVDAFDRPIVGGGKEAVAPPPLTVQNARELRSVIYDMEQAGQAPGESGVPGRYLRDLYKAIDQDIDAAIAKGSPELKKATQAADDFYRTSIQPLQQSDVAKLFLESDASGRLGGDEIVRRLFRGEGNLDALRAYRQVLGEKSPEWQLLVRQGMQTLLDDAGARTGRVDAEAFIRRLQQLNKTELADEILGPTGRAVANDARLLARAQGAKISQEELDDAMRAAPGRVSRLLQDAIAREEAFNRTYNTKLQQQLRDGTLGPRTIGSADDFVDRFVFESQAGAGEVRQALTQIAASDPAAAEGIRQQTLMKVLRDARAAIEPGQTTTELLNVQKLKDFATDPKFARAREALGPEGTQFVDDLATYAAANEKRLRAAGGKRTDLQTEGGRAVAAGMGHTITLGRLIGDALLYVPRAAVGTLADKSNLVRNYLATGELPVLTGGARRLAERARVPVLAAPEAERAREDILAEKP